MKGLGPENVVAGGAGLTEVEAWAPTLPKLAFYGKLFSWIQINYYSTIQLSLLRLAWII